MKDYWLFYFTFVHCFCFFVLERLTHQIHMYKKILVVGLDTTDIEIIVINDK